MSDEQRKEPIRYEIVTPRGPVLAGECGSIVLPEPQGEIGILKGHTPLLAALGTGVMIFKSEHAEKRVFISRGFLEVMNDRVIVLGETAEKAEEIDVARAKESRKRAMERLDLASPKKVVKPEDRMRARRAKERAEARFKAAGISLAD